MRVCHWQLCTQKQMLPGLGLSHRKTNRTDWNERVGGGGGFCAVVVVRVGMNRANSFPMQREVQSAVDQGTYTPAVLYDVLSKLDTKGTILTLKISSCSYWRLSFCCVHCFKRSCFLYIELRVSGFISVCNFTSSLPFLHVNGNDAMSAT
jgi:hypothetical protein